VHKNKAKSKKRKDFTHKDTQYKKSGNDNNHHCDTSQNKNKANNNIDSKNTYTSR